MNEIFNTQTYIYKNEIKDFPFNVDGLIISSAIGAFIDETFVFKAKYAKQYFRRTLKERILRKPKRFEYVLEICDFKTVYETKPHCSHNEIREKIISGEIKLE